MIVNVGYTLHSPFSKVIVFDAEFVASVMVSKVIVTAWEEQKGNAVTSMVTDPSKRSSVIGSSSSTLISISQDV